MNKLGPSAAVRALVVAVTFVVAGNDTYGEDRFISPIYMSVLPTPLTPGDNVQLNFSIPNVGIAVGSTFAPEVEINGNSILVNLIYHEPVIPPGGAQIQSAFFPDDKISLGMLGLGDYHLTAFLPGLDGAPVATGYMSFDVVPEPNSALLFALAAPFAFLTRRVTSR